MLSICRNVRPSVRLCVCQSVCLLLRYCLNDFLPPLLEVGCQKFLEIQNPWVKVVERSGLRFEHFFWKWSKLADFALHNMVETTLPNGLETCGQMLYH